MKTLKQICDAVIGRSGLDPEAQYVNGNDETIVYLANEALGFLSQQNWSKNRRTATISMTTATSYDLPTDLRYIVPDTAYVDENEKPVRFPLNDSEWWYWNTRSNDSGFSFKCRISNGSLEIENPESGLDLKFEYVTTYLVQSAGGTSADKEEFTRDDDYFTMDANLLIYDLKWRFKSEKGIEGWEKDKMIADKYFHTHKAREANAQTLCFGGRREMTNPEPYTDLYI